MKTLSVHIPIDHNLNNVDANLMCKSTLQCSSATVTCYNSQIAEICNTGIKITYILNSKSKALIRKIDNLRFHFD